MALKFRRGSTADKSGSLAYGEPYVNTSLGTLQIGGSSGDITLATIGDTSELNVSAVSASTFISASTLHITTNAEIKGNLTLGGNITIGDQTSDTVAVNANLSSSLIPSEANKFDLGSETKFWRDIYVSTGSIKFVNAGGTVVSSLSATSLNSNTESINSLNSYTASNNTNISAIQTSTSSLNAFSASVRASGSIINTFTASVNTSTSSLNSFSASVIATGSIINTFTSSVNTSTSSLNAFSASVRASGSIINTFTSSVNTSTASLNSFSASVIATGSIINTFTASVNTSTSSLNSFSSSVLAGLEFTSSNVTVKGNLLVKGTTTTIDSTTVNVADNIIQLNGTGATNAGIVVRDATAATTISGSFLWDTTNDKWIAGALGSEDDVVLRTLGQTLTNKTISGASNTLSNIANASLTNSSITIAGVSTALGSSITAATIGNAIGAFSGSSQVTLSSTTGYSAFSSSIAAIDASQDAEITALETASGSLNSFTSSINTTIKNRLTAEGVISGSSQVYSGVSGDVVIASNGVATIQANSVALGTDTTGDYVASLVAGTNITLTNNSGEGATPTIALTNNSITIAGQSTSLGGTITAATIGNAIGAFSGSSQVSHDSTTGYSANRHVDHTAVSITAGTGLTGGGDISTTRTLSIDSTVATLTGVQTLTNKTIAAASNTISGLTNSNLSGTAGISNANLANSSVTVTAGTGMSGGGTVALGSSITLTNAGVTSNVAGTGVTVSGATGAVTISIGQAVATSSNVQFNSLGVGMAASATAGRIDATNDIVAYSSSDRRFKNNIKAIEKPLDKINKISGNTFDWNEENKIEHGYEGNDVGVIAQEIEEVLPQLVQTRENGYKAVKYDKLVALLIEGIKEQQIQINDMKVEIENLKRQKGL